MENKTTEPSLPYGKDSMKCNFCQQWFDMSDLQQVFEHEHEGLEKPPLNKGVKQPTLPEIDWEKRYYQLERLIKADHPEFELPEYPVKPPKPKGDMPRA